MRAHQLKTDDYCELLDLGWRRSGRYCYKPINETTCCPNYSISCEALKFRLSTSQRKCIQKVNRFLLTGQTDAHDAEENLVYDESAKVESPSHRLDNITLDELRKSPKLRDKRLIKSCERKAKLLGITIEDALLKIKTKWISRQQPKLNLEGYLFPKLAKRKGTDETLKPKHRLEIKLLQVDSPESRALRQEEHRIIELYQESVHKEGPEEWTMRRFCDFLVDTPLVLERLQNFDFSKGETDDESCNFRCSFHLCHDEDPLVKPPALPTHLGTYHCSYHLDGELIGVGVLDLLPKCITTVYFFYNPKYNFLNLGTYSALMEISMVRHIHKHYSASTGDNRLIYYYLGYYVHECQKMHYKPKFKPSYLLCSETNTYIPTEICLLKLRDTKYARFAELNVETRSISLENSYVHISKMSIVVPELSRLNKMSEYFEWLSDNLAINYVDLMIRGYLYPFLKVIGTTLSQRLVLHGGPIHKELARLHENATQNQGRVQA